MPLAALVHLSQFGQPSFSEFVELHPSSEPRELLHDTQLIGRFVRGDFAFQKLADFAQGYALPAPGDQADAEAFP